MLNLKTKVLSKFLLTLFIYRIKIGATALLIKFADFLPGKERKNSNPILFTFFSSLSLSHFPHSRWFLSLYLCLFIYFSLSFLLSLSLSLSFLLSLSPFLSLSFFVNLCLCSYTFLSFFLFVYLFIFLSVSFFFSLSFFPSLSLSLLSPSFTLCLCLFIYLSLSLLLYQLLPWDSKKLPLTLKPFLLC